MPVDLQVTGAILGAGYDFNVGINAGHPPEVLQPLFDIAQVENIAARGRNSVPQPPTPRDRFLKAGLTDTPRLQRQRQYSRSQVLLLRHHSCSDIALGQYDVLHLIDDEHNALAAQAAAFGIRSGVQRPLKASGRLPDQGKPVDGEAGDSLTG